MELLFAFPETSLKDSILTIGTFDGVHLGHQQVIQRLVAVARQKSVPSVAITFTNHPKDILRPEKALERLSTLDQKKRELELLGLDVLVALTFSPELREKSAEVFLHEVRDSFKFSHIVLGHDAQFGKERRGNPEFMAHHARANGYTYEYLETFKHNDHTVSSTLIRAAIREGNLDEASGLLGRRYSLSGEVIKGDGRGRQLGFPTANVEVLGKCIPPCGVYSVLVRCGKKEYNGLANLGHLPTVKRAGDITLEVHLFEFTGDLYGEELEVEFHHFLRQEREFGSLEDLKKQIFLDVERAQALSW
jgi:riboflavin kinase/FMN adenylyltransferase